MALSAKEAADAVGMTKQGIIKSIRTGKISATKDIHGQWSIDPAELFRVYEPAKEVDSTAAINDGIQVNDGIQASIYHELEILRVKLAAEEEKATELKTQLHKAEERETQLLEVVKSQSRMLEQPRPNSAEPKRAGMFGWLFGK